MDQPERVRYFDQQFLRVDDFNAEQDYHRDMRRRHNRILHTPGIADGLQLVADGTGVKITPGAAIPGGTDANGGGAEVVLAGERRQELSSFANNADVYVTIAFAQEETRFKDDAGVQGNTRWLETPKIEAFTSDPTATPPSDPSQPWRVLLGRVVRGGAGGKDVTAIDGTGRRLAGSAESELSLTPRDPAVQEPDWVRLRWTARGQADVTGSLRIQPGGPTAGDLSVAGAMAANGSLTVTGGGEMRSLRLAAGGANADGLRFHAAGTAAGGDVRIASEAAGSLAIQASQTYTTGRLGVATTAPAHALHVAGNAQLGNVFVGDVGHGASWAGFSHGSAIGAASYGLLQSNDGRYTLVNKRSGGGTIEFRVDNATKLSMDDSGNLSTGPLTVSGDVLARAGIIVGAGSNGTLRTRHIDGKRGDNDDFDALHLNWASGQPVNVGGGARADLHVYGGIAAHAGDLFLDNAQSLRSSGRLHIATEERLYLLAKGAVYLTADWGGPGDLYTSGSIYCAGRGPGDRPTGHGAGIITWDVEAKGGVYSPHKQFVIDHPLDPDGRHLVHACIEGPEYAVYYRGEGVLENGEAEVALPDYFEALTHAEGRTVQLTPKVGPGGEVPVLGATAVADGRFTVRAPDHPHPDQGFFWEIKAVRADIEALAVELIKRDVAVPA